MKRITIDSEHTISLNELNDSHLIGYEFMMGYNLKQRKGFILKVRPQCYIVAPLIKNSDYDFKVEYESIRGAVESLIGTGVVEFYAFDEVEKMRKFLYK